MINICNFLQMNKNLNYISKCYIYLIDILKIFCGGLIHSQNYNIYLQSNKLIPYFNWCHLSKMQSHPTTKPWPSCNLETFKTMFDFHEIFMNLDMHLSNVTIQREQNDAWERDSLITSYLHFFKILFSKSTRCHFIITRPMNGYAIDGSIPKYGASSPQLTFACI
jgi:hypothetical protein